MLTILVVTTQGGAQLPGFEFDSVEPEKHVRNMIVVKHPLEKGARNVDALLVDIAEFSIEGFISNHPINATIFDGRQVGNSGSGVLTFPSSDFARDAQKLLEQYQENAALLDVVTSQKSYKDMALAGMEITREPGGARFNLKFEQVTIASISQGNAPKPLVTKAAPKVNKGAQQGTKPAPGANAQQQASLLYQLKLQLGGAT